MCAGQVRTSEYNQLKGQLGQMNRKQGGSLAVRDISSLVSEGDVTDTEYLTTQFVVVSKFSKQEFQEQYESLTEYVVSSLTCYLRCAACTVGASLASAHMTWGWLGITSCPDKESRMCKRMSLRRCRGQPG